jgi:hypothetical protein
MSIAALLQGRKSENARVRPLLVPPTKGSAQNRDFAIAPRDQSAPMPATDAIWGILRRFTPRPRAFRWGKTHAKRLHARA